jgi:glycoprotein 3-alpha-L-fucosyltransferase
MRINFTWVVILIMLVYTIVLFFILEWVLPTESHNVHSSMLPQEHHILNTKHINVPPIPPVRSREFNVPIQLNGRQCLTNRTSPYDFDRYPVLLASPQYPWLYDDDLYRNVPCDVNCVATRDWNGRVYFRADGLLFHQSPPIHKICPHQKSIYYTMENRIQFDWEDTEKRVHDLSLHTVGNPDVYASYFNYVLDLMKSPRIKTKKALASAYISNCDDATPMRVHVINKLIASGIDIDLFGSCFGELNKPELNMQIGSPVERKMDNIANYKFHLVFENSQGNGYVTEKYWQALHAGTVPIVLGAPDIRRYEPRKGSILVVDEFSTIEELSAEMKRIGGDDTAYNKMLEWKKIGFSKQFLVAIQYTSVSYECQLCIKIADQIVPQVHTTAILVRESLTYYYRALYLSEFTLYELKLEILNAFKDHRPVWFEKRPNWDKKTLRIHRIVLSGQKYEDLLWGDAIDSDFKVRTLVPGTHIEVIFV